MAYKSFLKRENWFVKLILKADQEAGRVPRVKQARAIRLSLSLGDRAQTLDSPVVIISLKVVVELEGRTAAQDKKWKRSVQEPQLD